MRRARRAVVMVPAWHGQLTVEQLDAQAAAGARPRTDYVELAAELDADVMDMEYMQTRATRTARAVAARVGIVPGQITEAFVRSGQFEQVVARADRLGLPLALALKASRGRRDTVLVSVWLSRRKKAVFLRPGGAHTHLGAVVNYNSVQRDIAHRRLGVPAGKLHHARQPVDESFYRPEDVSPGDYVLAVGYEQRDYPTFLAAVRELDVDVEIAIGSTVLKASGDVTDTFAPLVGSVGERLPERVTVHQQLPHRTLRDLYARARLVVVPLLDVDFDPGVTVIAEAMAMGKAVVVTAARGQRDLVRHGVHGLYVPPGDPVALRAAIRRLLDDPEEARRMGEAGRALAESELTLSGWVRDVAGIARAARR
ncbi:MAG TPA: glycosyltransferase family 4 protein [Mycobacteriales bacterium]|nr:glycosyltransferase family 4 protein [Mycobacteriales bacterium]